VGRLKPELLERSEDFADRVLDVVEALAAKESTETRFWLRLIARRSWPDPSRLQPLLSEAEELKRILGASLHKTRPPATDARSNGRLPA